MSAPAAPPAPPPAIPPGVVIGLPTCRRAALAAALASLARLDPVPCPVRVVVADNDEAPSARVLVEAAAAGHPLPVAYLHAPARNISVARNAILAAARGAGARFLAWLDDDETAAPGWLAALLARQAETGAAAVLGPVRGRYGPGAPDWMRRGALHDTRPVTGRGGQVLYGYTSNALIDLAHPALRGLGFDPALGRTGGEDTAFFKAVTEAGGAIAFAPAALVEEAVPPERARLGWLLTRRYRIGQTHARLFAPSGGSARRLGAAGVSAAKALACLGMAGLCAFDRLGRNRALIRGALHAGVLAELAGLARVEPYGRPPEPAAGVRGEGGR
ncbi:MAG: glycosyltransferase [Rhodobacteraceae bacterium]|nr:glycosyltransferase [Paracoccaceae bacterium]